MPGIKPGTRNLTNELQFVKESPYLTLIFVVRETSAVSFDMEAKYHMNLMKNKSFNYLMGYAHYSIRMM